MSEINYLDLLENLNSGVIVHAADTSILLTNNKARKLLGLTKEQLKGRTAMHPGWAFLRENGSLMPVEEYPVNQVISTGEIVDKLVVGIRKPGCAGICWALCTASPIRDIQGRLNHVVVNFVDITERKKIEKEFALTAEEWETTFNSSNDAIWILDINSIVQRSNKTAEKVFNRPRQEMIGRHCCTILHREPHHHPHCPFEKLKNSRQRETMELQDGDRWLEVTVDPILNASGELKGAVHIVSDITEYKHVEETVRERERQLSTLLSNLPGMAYRCLNEPHWPMEFVSEGCVELTGWSADQIVNENPGYGELILEEDRDMVWNNVQNALKQNRPFELMYRLTTNNGQLKWVWERGTGVFDQNGSLLFLEGFIADITEHRIAELEKQKHEERFRRLLEKAPFPVCYANSYNQLTFRNDRFLEVFGYTEEDAETIEEWWLKAYPDPEYRKQVIETWTAAVDKSAREGTDIEPSEYLVTCKDGTKRVMEISGIVLGRNLLATFIDQTERVQFAEEKNALINQLEERNEELEQFSYTVSHDLKTPLITIGSFVGHLKHDLKCGDEENIAKDLDFIEKSARQMHNLLSNLLHLARSGRSLGEPVEVDFNDLIERALKAAKGLTENCKLKVHIEDSLPTVYGDPVRLLEVFQNLIENAVKFSLPGKTAEIEIECSVDRGFVLCRVADNGIGIEPQYHQQIFSLFEKLDKNEAGTGIGLAVVKRIVEKHRGQIWVESEGSGKGSTFFFTLPSLASDQA